MRENIDTNTQNNLQMAAEILNEYGNEIREMIRFHIKNEPVVDDIFQELFLSIVRSPIPQRNKDVRGDV